MAAWAARRGASSAGSRPNAATRPVGVSSSTRPPKLCTLAMTASSARLDCDQPSTLSVLLRSTRSRVRLRRSHRSRGVRGRRADGRRRGPLWAGSGLARAIRAQAELLQARIHGVARDPEPDGGRARCSSPSPRAPPGALPHRLVSARPRSPSGGAGAGTVVLRLQRVPGCPPSPPGRIGEQGRALDDIGQLADIAGPGVREQPRLGLGIQALRAAARTRRRRGRGTARRGAGCPGRGRAAGADRA